MAESKIITLPKVGDVLFERSYRAKHINISVKPPNKIRVAVPVGVEFQKARKIAEQKEYWIEKQIAKFFNSSVTPVFYNVAAEDFIYKEKYLIKRVETLAEKYGFRYNKLRFKVMKSRWGSCSAKNNINLNMSMSFLPKMLQDYIILHELAHTRIKNHSKDYWILMDKIIDDAKGLHKELKGKYVFFHKN